MASTIDIIPIAGHAGIPTQLGVGSDPGYDAIDLRRMAQVGNREGVHDSAGWAVSEHTPNDLSVNVAATVGLATVEGDSIAGQGFYVIAPHGSVANLTPARAPDGVLPRVDSVVLRMYDDQLDGSGMSKPRLEFIEGTPTAGATKTNRNGAAPLPATALLLADVLIRAGAVTITNTDIQDRRDSAVTNEQPGDLIQSAASSRVGCILLTGSGQTVSRSTYAKLFAAIGTSHGVGDGSTTFGLPDASGRALIGSGAGAGLTARANGQKTGEESHILTSAELASHTHIQNAHAHSGSSGGHSHTFDGGGNTVLSIDEPAGGGEYSLYSDAAGNLIGTIYYLGVPNWKRLSNTDPTAAAVTVDAQTATNQNAGGGGSHNNMQPSTVVNVFIKF